MRFILIPFVLIMLNSCNVDRKESSALSKEVRFATYNVALSRDVEGGLLNDLEGGNNMQAKNVAEIIQRVRPDILLLQEFDYDEKGEALKLFRDRYLMVGQKGQELIDYPYYHMPKTNTGLASNIDFNGDGKVQGGRDAFGFGLFHGQYAFVLLSKYPIDTTRIRSFQKLLWKDMPEANLPYKEDGQSYYSKEALNVFRVSSKNHIDVPINIDGKLIHVLAAHPTPPVFDGKEDRNGKRNYDEIRLLADYISNKDYIVDDAGKSGGFQKKSFVIMGDMNADPVDGDSYNHAINQLINHPLINSEVAKGKYRPKSQGGVERAHAKKDSASLGDPAFDTSHWGLRVDYVLPSKEIEVKDSGVFWPTTDSDLSYLMQRDAASDHLLVWVDLVINADE